jgi:hypothetical protein
MLIKIFPLVLILFSTSAFAKVKIIRQCTTIGDALSEVQIIEDKKGDQYINVVEMDMTSKKYLMISDYDFKAKMNKTYIAAGSLDSEMGGQVPDALMLEIWADKRTATLAHRGSIFFLICN